MFTGSENHDIPLSEAAEMTARYRATMAAGSRKGGFFGAQKLREILDQRDCVGIRYYYGLDENNQQVLVLTGVKADENDIVDGIIAEAAIPCPSQCGNNNILNS